MEHSFIVRYTAGRLSGGPIANASLEPGSLDDWPSNRISSHEITDPETYQTHQITIYWQYKKATQDDDLQEIMQNILQQLKA